MLSKSLFGKYRFLVVSIALFLIFDLGVLVLNFYTSGKITEQTELINLAGRQRTLTQQMSKATLYIKSQKLQQWVYQSGLDELRDHFQTFDETLSAFNVGGEITAIGTGLPISIKAVHSTEGLAILNEVNLLWSGFEQAVKPLMVDTLITDEEIKPASAFIAVNNLKMFGYMDKLTEHFTKAAEKQTALLRRAQIIGISFATINFFVILFHFLGQLQRRDRELKLKQHESDQILRTIGDGVFLLDTDLTMSGQHSKQLEKIFATKRLSGHRFDRFLARYLPHKTVATAIDFVNLYFQKHIDLHLITDVNPLKRVSVSVQSGIGAPQQKFLDFTFARLDKDNGAPSILVTVNDVTATILLEEQDQQASDELDEKMALLTQILPINRADLGMFLLESTKGCDQINALLKDTKHVGDHFEKPLAQILRETHKLKGIASALGFDWIVSQYHSMENTTSALLDLGRKKRLNGRDLLPLTIQLRGNYNSLELISDLQKRLGEYGKPDHITTEESSQFISEQVTNREDEHDQWKNLAGFANRLAIQEQKRVSVALRGFEPPLKPNLSAKLYPLAIQLIRNAIAHGIEHEKTRCVLKKPNIGQIYITLSHDENGNYRFVFEDDGRGFDYQRIRKKIVCKGLINADNAKDLKNSDLIRYAFNDKISTRDKVDQLAGRGVGLSLILQQIKALDGRLKIRSEHSEFTRFIIDFSHIEETKQVIPTMIRKVS